MSDRQNMPEVKRLLLGLAVVGLLAWLAFCGLVLWPAFIRWAS